MTGFVVGRRGQVLNRMFRLALWIVWCASLISHVWFIRVAIVAVLMTGQANSGMLLHFRVEMEIEIVAWLA